MLIFLTPIREYQKLLSSCSYSCLISGTVSLSDEKPLNSVLSPTANQEGVSAALSGVLPGENPGTVPRVYPLFMRRGKWDAPCQGISTGKCEGSRIQLSSQGQRPEEDWAGGDTNKQEINAKKRNEPKEGEFDPMESASRLIDWARVDKFISTNEASRGNQLVEDTRKSSTVWYEEEAEEQEGRQAASKFTTMQGPRDGLEDDLMWSPFMPHLLLHVETIALLTNLRDIITLPLTIQAVNTFPFPLVCSHFASLAKAKSTSSNPAHEDSKSKETMSMTDAVRSVSFSPDTYTNSSPPPSQFPNLHNAATVGASYLRFRLSVNLFDRFPYYTEEELTLARESYISTQSLSSAARRLHIYPHLLRLFSKPYERDTRQRSNHPPSHLENQITRSSLTEIPEGSGITTDDRKVAHAVEVLIGTCYLAEGAAVVDSLIEDRLLLRPPSSFPCSPLPTDLLRNLETKAPPSSILSNRLHTRDASSILSALTPPPSLYPPMFLLQSINSFQYQTHQPYQDRQLQRLEGAGSEEIFFNISTEYFQGVKDIVGIEYVGRSPVQLSQLFPSPISRASLSPEAAKVSSKPSTTEPSYPIPSIHASPSTLGSTSCLPVYPLPRCPTKRLRKWLKRLIPLQQKIRYRFRDRALVLEAFTHGSYETVSMAILPNCLCFARLKVVVSRTGYVRKRKCAIGCVLILLRLDVY